LKSNARSIKNSIANRLALITGLFSCRFGAIGIHELSLTSLSVKEHNKERTSDPYIKKHKIWKRVKALGSRAADNPSSSIS